ncbi:HTH-type transcriptional regulator CysL [Methyloligella halotolerans]|uniref:HTH-type transcriptional regulator CysL n=1 Tax=Methyloligella halotolerans TaxID=1177755 RepID=A0A1E2RV03_9HYPH|nr:LysR family transcriptional regulator [Methyloligella halotolerans]ODA65928.1 HTH-type transcriptional regulator CysL [Methyloligella halotolerans]
MRLALTLEQIRIFSAVADRQHVTRAAQDLHLTQSAVSAAISGLERRYGIRLFDRVGRRIQLTQAGLEFLPEAKALLARAEHTGVALTELSGLKRGRLRLAASQTVGSYWLPPFMQQYHDVYPGIALSLAIGNTEGVAAKVVEGSAEIGFVEGEVEHPQLESIPIAEDELLLVVSPERWGTAKASAQSLRGHPWIFREPGSGTRALMEEGLACAGIAAPGLEIALTFPSNEAVRAAVEAGAGITVLSKLVVESQLTSGRLIALDFPLPKRQFFALRHKERGLTKAEQAFQRLIEENCQSLEPSRPRSPEPA